MKLVGLISDSHGRVDPRIHQAFANVDLIVHAGDICDADVLDELETIAPVKAVLGNCDVDGLGSMRMDSLLNFEVEGVRIGVVHDRHDSGSLADSVEVIVFGHSHMPYDEYEDGVRWINPGSAQQARRSPFGRTVGLLEIDSGEVADYRLVPLDEFGEQRLIPRRRLDGS